MPTTSDVRFETAVETGSQVSIHFDSMIAKIVVWAPTRSMAIRKAADVLSHTMCIGIKTNQRFLQNCLLHPNFQDPAYTTAFIPQNLQKLLSDPYFDIPVAHRKTLALIPSIFLRNVLHSRKKGPFRQIQSGFRNQRFDPVSGQFAIISTGHDANEMSLLCQWVSETSNLRSKLIANLQPLPAATPVADASAASQVTAQYNAISNALRQMTSKEITSHEFEVSSCKAVVSESKKTSPWVNASMTVLIDQNVYHCYLATKDCELGSFSSTGHPKEVYCQVLGYGSWFACRYYDLLSYCESTRQVAQASREQHKVVTAPMPCKVLNVLKNSGEEVKEGEAVVVVESMKMEMNIFAPSNGIFKTSVKKNDAVNEGTVLCEIE
jgi:acetyl/propionyl-CoA carboxylase alpha subunit